MDLNLFDEFGFTKDVDISSQLAKVMEESEEVYADATRVSYLLGAVEPLDTKMLEEALGDLEKELLDNMLALYNMYKIVSKIGNKRDSFMEWYQKMKGYKDGKYKELVEE